MLGFKKCLLTGTTLTDTLPGPDRTVSVRTVFPH